MIYRFDGYEVDVARRELRARGAPRPLQPQAFDVLAYLIRHRDRAVSKRELLDTLWADAEVGEGSLQRAISLARSAIDDGGTRIRTLPKVGYRFAAAVEEIPGGAPPAPAPLVPRYARSGDVHVAYLTIGGGDLDLVVVPGWVFPMRAFLDHPAPRALIDALARRGRVILFDKRGTGLSDRVVDVPTLDERMDDLRAVLDAAGARRPVLVGLSEGGPLCLRFATRFPDRTAGLVLVGAFARWAAAPDYPHGWTDAAVDELRRYMGAAWGAGETVRAIVASHRDDPEIRAWAARAEQEGASPGAALALLEMNLRIDARALLPAVAAPTAVVHATRDAVIDAGNGRYLAAHIPGARLFEVDGADHVPVFDGAAALDDALAWVVSKR